MDEGRGDCSLAGELASLAMVIFLGIVPENRRRKRVCELLNTRSSNAIRAFKFDALSKHGRERIGHTKLCPAVIFCPDMRAKERESEPRRVRVERLKVTVYRRFRTLKALQDPLASAGPNQPTPARQP